MRTRTELWAACAVVGLLMSGVIACSDDEGDEGGDARVTDLGSGDLGSVSDTKPSTDAHEQGDMGTAGDMGTDDTGVNQDGATSDTGTSFWTSSYNANCRRSGSSHNQGKACGSCHSGSGGPPNLVLGGTVYTSASSTTGASAVEVGIKDNTQLLTTCTDNNGNFYLTSGTVDWTTAKIMLRSADGESEITHPTPQASGSCNQCHTSAKKLVQP